MFRFEWLWAFAALPLPLLVYRLAPPAPEAHAAALRVPFFAALRTLAAGRARRVRPRQLLGGAAWLLLVLAAARPQWVGEPVALPQSGRELMLAVDVSGSMKMQDMQLAGAAVTRLAMVQQVAGEFVERRAGDRLGLILFGTRAYLQTPLTFDRRSIGQSLAEAEIGLAGERTAIGDAIGLAVKRLRGRPAASRVLILLTDGANTAGAIVPQRAAQLAAEAGLRVHTIGVGADQLLVRDLFGTRRIDPSAELDEATLQSIAQTTGGRYFRARDTEGLRAIYALLDELEPVAGDPDRLRPVAELFVWPLGLAMLIAALLALLGVPFRMRDTVGVFGRGASGDVLERR